ncbi:hypothetical protein ON010_g15402 [Phytophthora cinnamomi]|nr:hypothetical protein ON010_g15402 [Phytophthora cinnamomi]
MRRPLQPTGVAGSPPRGATFDHSAAASTSGHTTDAATVAAVQQAQTAGRSSVSLASAAAYEMQDGVRRSAEASLAMAELKLAEQGKFAPRVESQEGGADYVSASIMDSLLLDQQKSNKAAT